ncbi:YwaF family protein, partial [Akkermansiaceae bacterium]|nr:YwaF family protein [Akkermansiaceae bacterium]
WSWGYMAIVMTINWIIGRNYGFLNGLPNPGTLFDHMGPYPYYLITLQGIAFTLYFILLKIAPKPSTEKLPKISGKTRAS